MLPVKSGDAEASECPLDAGKNVRSELGPEIDSIELGGMTCGEVLGKISSNSPRQASGFELVR